MSFKYGLGVLDAQYLLRRNYTAIRGSSGGSVNSSDLIKSFLQSVNKIRNNFDIQRVVLCWDKGPYRKTSVVNQYKKDRHYTTSSDLDELRELMLGMEGEELEEAERELARMKVDLNSEQAFYNSRLEIIANLHLAGYYSLMKPGYEADDLAYFIATEAERRKVKTLLVTIDRDWVTFCNKYVRYITPNGDTRFNMLKEKVLQSKELGVSLYELGVLSEIYSGSHNNVMEYPYKDHIDFSEFTRSVMSNDEKIPDFERVKSFYDVMDMRDMYEGVKSMVESCFETQNMNFSNFTKYSFSKHIFVKHNDIQKLIEGWLEPLTPEG